MIIMGSTMREPNTVAQLVNSTFRELDDNLLRSGIRQCYRMFRDDDGETRQRARERCLYILGHLAGSIEGQ